MENLQVQRKKMSLANIEGRLTLEEMENVMAGSCDPTMQSAIAGAFGGLVFGPVGGFVYWAFVYSAQGNGKRCI